MGEYHIILFLRRYFNKDVVASNIYLFGNEHDFVRVTKAGYVYSYEIKTSRSDFRAQQRKSLDERGFNFFSYVCPSGLINEADLKAGQGLYHVTPKGQIVEMVKPARNASSKLRTAMSKIKTSVYHKYHHQEWAKAVTEIHKLRVG
jgi:hypothetical protein